MTYKRRRNVSAGPAAQAGGSRAESGRGWSALRGRWCGRARTAVVLFLAAAAAPAAVTAQNASLSALVQLDHEGTVTERTLLAIAGSRWLWIASGRLLLADEVAVAGGYTRQRTVVRSPLEGLSHSVGCAVGPLVLGPIDPRGALRRELDPTEGSVTWDAQSAPSEARLDTAVAGTRWSGAVLQAPRGRLIRPLAMWLTDDLMDDSPDEQVEIVHARVELAPAGVAPESERRALLSAGASYAEFPRRHASAWVGESAGPAVPGIEQFGAGVDTGVFSPRRGRVAYRAGLEGHSQWWGYRRPRWSANAWMRAEGPRRRVALRAMRAATGFVALDGSHPASAELFAAQINGEAGGSAGGESGRRPLDWRAAWERARGWEEGAPAPAEHTLLASLSHERTAGDPLGWTLTAGAVVPEGRAEESDDRRHAVPALSEIDLDLAVRRRWRWITVGGSAGAELARAGGLRRGRPATVEAVLSPELRVTSAGGRDGRGTSLAIRGRFDSRLDRFFSERARIKAPIGARIGATAALPLGDRVRVESTAACELNRSSDRRREIEWTVRLRSSW